MPDMIEVKVAEAEGATLDWMVAQAADLPVRWEFEHGEAEGDRGRLFYDFDNPTYRFTMFSPSTNWNQAGPLIDRFEIELFISATAKGRRGAGIKGRCAVASDSYLLSAMRVLVRAELGDTVAVPAELQRKEDNPT